jgi:hypothetical protein
MAIDNFFLPFTGDVSWVADKRRGVNPIDRKMVCLVRPRFDQWGFDVQLSVEDSEIDIELAVQVLRVAGSFVGLGDFRPDCRGPFGRFRVTDWKELST